MPANDQVKRTELGINGKFWLWQSEFVLSPASPIGEHFRLIRAGVGKISLVGEPFQHHAKIEPSTHSIAIILEAESATSAPLIFLSAERVGCCSFLWLKAGSWGETTTFSCTRRASCWRRRLWAVAPNFAAFSISRCSTRTVIGGGSTYTIRPAPAGERSPGIRVGEGGGRGTYPARRRPQWQQGSSGLEHSNVSKRSNVQLDGGPSLTATFIWGRPFKPVSSGL